MLVKVLVIVVKWIVGGFFSVVVLGMGCSLVLVVWLGWLVGRCG